MMDDDDDQPPKEPATSVEHDDKTTVKGEDVNNNDNDAMKPESNSTNKNNDDKDKNNASTNPSSTTGTDNTNKRKRRKRKKNSVQSAPAGSTTPMTVDGAMPQKKFYRQRAHCNPLAHNDAFIYPVQPTGMDWTTQHYPAFRNTNHNQKKDENGTARAVAQPTVLDIGCGFGGLTVALATLLPDEIILGMEIRAKVTEYVRLRIMALRQDHQSKPKPTPPTTTVVITDAAEATTTTTEEVTAIMEEASSSTAGVVVVGPYDNASVLRTNSMKFLPNYFAKQSITKLFFCFPDPHFKRKNFPRRIVSTRLLDEYAYVLRPQVGKLYTITDVQALHEWHVAQCAAHPLFARIPDDELVHDPCVHAMITETEEGKKVARNKGQKYYAVYRYIQQEDNENDEKWNSHNFFDASISSTSASVTNKNVVSSEVEEEETKKNDVKGKDANN